jgi:hypothetical protein
VRREGLGDPLIQFGDIVPQGRDQFDQAVSYHCLSLQHGHVGRGRYSLADGLDALLVALLGTAVLLMKEIA